jgi:amphi-Trp domain-containing protein
MPQSKSTAASKRENGGSASREDVSSERAKLGFESFLPREEAVAYFEAIVAGLKKGAIQFKQDDESLTLNPPSHLDIEVKASRKKGRERISFEVSWRAEEPSDLTIVSS